MVRALLFLLLVAWGQAWGATWYVDCSAPSDGSNAGTAYTVPFERLTDLNWTTINTGDDDVLFAAGSTCTGQLNVQASGTSSNQIEIGVYNTSTGAQVTDGSATATMDSNNAAGSPVNISGQSWVRVIGLKGRGSNAASDTTGQINVQSASADVTLDYVIADSTGLGNNYTGISINGSDRVTLKNYIADGFARIGVMVYQNPTTSRTGHIIRDGTITNIGVTSGNANASGIWFQCDTAGTVHTNMTVTGNTIDQIGTYPLDTAGSGIRSFCVLKNSLIAENTITDVGIAGVYFLSGTGGAVSNFDWSGTVVRDNTVRRAGRFGFWNAGADYVRYPRNVATDNGANSGQYYGRGFEIVGASASFDSSTAAATIGTGYNVAGATGVTFTATGEFATKGAAIVGQKIVSKTVANPGVMLITAQGSPSSDQVVGTILSPFSSSSLSANGYMHGIAPTGVYISDSESSGNYNYISNCSEGSGFGFDDYTSLSAIERSYSHDNEGAAFDINMGVGNVVTGNISINDGDYCRAGAALTSSSAVKNNGLATRVENTSMFRTRETRGGWDQATRPSPIGVVNCCSLSSFVAKNVLIQGFKVGYWLSTADAETYSRLFDIETYEARRNDNSAASIDATSAVVDPQTASATPDSAEGACLTPDSPLLGAGTYLGAWATGYRGKDLGKPPAIGAMALCRARAVAAERPASATRPTH